MKKLILPLLLLVAFGMLAAVESDPSEVVGYFKLDIADNQWQAISMPFDYGVTPPVVDVLGMQFSENDFCMDIETSDGATYVVGYGWDGTLTNMEYGKAYYVNRYAGNGAGTYYLLGSVDPNGFTKTIYGNGAWTPFGLNEAANVALTDALFGTVETENDFILEINSSEGATYVPDYGWDGTLTDLHPHEGYYYNTAGASNFSWTYTPTRGGAAQPTMSNNSKNSK